MVRRAYSGALTPCRRPERSRTVAEVGITGGKYRERNGFALSARERRVNSRMTTPAAAQRCAARRAEMQASRLSFNRIGGI